MNERQLLGNLTTNDRILIVDGDAYSKPDRSTGIPNLALMKISAYFKGKGYEIGLNTENPTAIIGSSAFTWNAPNLSGLKTLYPNCKIILGGSGIGLDNYLPYEIEHTRPDYDMFRTIHAMGRTSWGCVNQCPFCIAWRKEGAICRDHAPITEFWDESQGKLLLIDNNFLASPNWRANLDFIRDNGITVNFNQGLDIRRVNQAAAHMLAEVRYSNQNWTGRKLIFAWDFPHIEPSVRSGIERLAQAGIRANRLEFYVLTGYNTDFEQDYYRFKVLDSLGVDPFIMVYNKQGPPLVKHFARFVNKRLYRTRTFAEYDRLSPNEQIRVAGMIDAVDSKFELEGGLA